MSNRPGRKIARKRAHAAAKQSASVVDQQARQQKMIGIALGLILVVGAAIAIIATIASGDDADNEIAFNGDFLPPYIDSGVDPAVGTKAPIFVTTDFDGNRVVTGSGGGPNDTAKLIGFFAHWCPVCQAELPVVTDWIGTRELPDRVEVVLVSTLENSSRGNHPPDEWFEREGWPLPVLVDSSNDEIAEAFGLVSVPYWVVLDDFNRVLMRTTGGLSADQLDGMVALAADALS